MSAVAIMIVTGIFMFINVDVDSLDITYVIDIAIDNMAMLIGGTLLLGLYAGKSDDKNNHAMFRMIFSLIALFFSTY